MRMRFLLLKIRLEQRALKIKLFISKMNSGLCRAVRHEHVEPFHVPLQAAHWDCVKADLLAGQRIHCWFARFKYRWPGQTDSQSVGFCAV
ncbi:MAG: hypothetical protein PHX68_03535 [Alphaproteobacteria bacterium]|nr:hypothetical protein [Alphaproteobacteria bacterium]